MVTIATLFLAVTYSHAQLEASWRDNAGASSRRMSVADLFLPSTTLTSAARGLKHFKNIQVQAALLLTDY